jgi:hypothetical protein
MKRYTVSQIARRTGIDPALMAYAGRAVALLSD